VPELPEVEALRQFIADHMVGSVVGRVDVTAINVVKSAVPPITDLSGRDVTEAGRWGKYLGLGCAGLWLVTHLSRGGWARWRVDPGRGIPKAGKGALALRLHLFAPDGSAPAFDLTEAGTTKRLAVWLVPDPLEVPGIARLGPDALTLSQARFADILHGTGQRLKTSLVDQSLLAGIGNAYSDEIMHRARLSPFVTPASLSPEAMARAYDAMRAVLTEAVGRLVGRDVARLKDDKRSGMRVHGRTGLPCPVCGDTVRAVSYTERSFQYCPTCQTGGRILADRRMSRLLK
jgi:formamidopyrimidine-DNA glycosylase